MKDRHRGGAKAEAKAEARGEEKKTSERSRGEPREGVETRYFLFWSVFDGAPKHWGNIGETPQTERLETGRKRSNEGPVKGHVDGSNISEKCSRG